MTDDARLALEATGLTIDRREDANPEVVLTTTLNDGPSASAA